MTGDDWPIGTHIAPAKISEETGPTRPVFVRQGANFCSTFQKRFTGTTGYLSNLSRKSRVVNPWCGLLRLTEQLASRSVTFATPEKHSQAAFTSMDTPDSSPCRIQASRPDAGSSLESRHPCQRHAAD
jgi:hypothetical protein